MKVNILFNKIIGIYLIWLSSVDNMCILEFIPVISISDLKDIINDPANTSERVEKICKYKRKDQ